MTCRRLLGAAAGAVLLSACGPKVITDVSLSPTTAKLTWVKKSLLYPETGVLECRRAEDGSLSECVPLEITFREPSRPAADDSDEATP